MRSRTICRTAVVEVNVVGHVVGCSMLCPLGGDVCGQVGGMLLCVVHVLFWHLMGVPSCCGCGWSDR